MRESATERCKIWRQRRPAGVDAHAVLNSCQTNAVTMNTMDDLLFVRGLDSGNLLFSLCDPLS